MNKRPKETGDGLMPGDPSKEELVESMIRVDHAGEHGAVRIYEGQLAVLAALPDARQDFPLKSKYRCRSCTD